MKRWIPLFLMLTLCFVWGSALADLVIPTGTTVIEDSAFYSDSSLSIVVLPDGILRIESKAFRNCGLTRVNLPDSLTYVADDAFDGNSGMTVIANKNSQWYTWAKNKGFIVDTETAAVSGSFTYSSDTVTIGEKYYLKGSASVTNGTLGKVTVNTKYYDVSDYPYSEVTRSFSGVSNINLENFSGTYVFDTSKEPFNTPDDYTINLHVKASDNTYALVDSMTLTTVENTAVYGSFTNSSDIVTIGQKYYLKGSASVSNGTLSKVTVNTKYYDVSDYPYSEVSKSFSSGSSLMLEDYSGTFVFDTSKAPFNTPGTYTINLHVKAADGTYALADSMTLTTIRPASDLTFSGNFVDSYHMISLGGNWIINANVSVAGGSGYLGAVTINSPDVSTTMTDNFTGHNYSSVSTKDWGAYMIDTTESPWNVPGTYRLRLWAKDTNGDGGFGSLDEMTVEIIDGEPIADSWVYPATVGSFRQWNAYSESMANKGRPYHVALDLGTGTEGETVKAAANGVVTYVKNNDNNYKENPQTGNGNQVVIKHTLPNGNICYSFYAHLKKWSVTVSVGDIVTVGQKIAEVGRTGSASNGVNHCHFSIVNKNSSDFLGYVPNSAGTTNKNSYNGVTFYNPAYVINNSKLP